MTPTFTAPLNVSADRRWVGRHFGGYSQVVDNDAVAVLEKDHSTVQDLFSRVSGQDEDRPAVLKELLRTLSAHVATEKQLVVPLLRRHGEEGKALADELGGEHRAIEKLVVLVERRKVNSPDVPDLVNELLDITDRHIARANGRLFGFLRETVDPAELADLGEALRSDEVQLLSHPHPHLPDTGPLAVVSRKAAALFDRGRDSTADLNRSSS